MRLLLDTHTFPWYVSGDARLSHVARRLIDDPASQAFVSLITMWEVGIKHAKGRLDLDDVPDVFFASEMAKNRFAFLEPKPPHVFAASALPLTDHRDPFDRALVAQAMIEGMTLVSADRKLDPYGVSRLF